MTKFCSTDEERGKAFAGKTHHSLVLTYILGRLEVFLFSETKQPDLLQHWRSLSRNKKRILGASSLLYCFAKRQVQKVYDELDSLTHQ